MLSDKYQTKLILWTFGLLQEEISVTGIKYSTFTSILEFIYTGKVNCSLNASTIVELYLSTLLFMQNL